MQMLEVMSLGDITSRDQRVNKRIPKIVLIL
jgi:hypothetical protein